MKKSILIVEDDDFSMKLFSDLLQVHGFDTLQSTDGLDTLQLARAHRPDLIIMDIQLPKISGFDHIRMLKADHDLKHIPVIAVTALAMRGDEKKTIEAGFDGYLSKPISAPHFLSEMKKYLAMGPFRLTASLVVGHAEIDAEHDALGARLNQFMDCRKVGDDKGCAEIIAELVEAVERHFDHEIRIMTALGYTFLKLHKKEHDRIMEKCHELMTVSKAQGFGDNIADELTSIVVQDMIMADMDFRDYLSAHNPSVSS